jgi:CubicO group peptidase (beta-lactamase class C family)
MLSQKLSFTPGTKSTYSNFGWCVLADTIAHLTGLTYQRAATELLLDPLQIHDTALAPATPGSLLPGEVHSYGQQENASGPTSPQEAPLQASEGTDSWTSTASDLERFLIATAGTKPGANFFTTWPGGDNGPYTPPVSQQAPISKSKGAQAEVSGSTSGSLTTWGVDGPVTWVMLANSMDPSGPSSFNALSQLAEKEMSAPASSWPAGNLLGG